MVNLCETLRDGGTSVFFFFFARPRQLFVNFTNAKRVMTEENP